jgi:hypothetical protein
MPEEYLQNIITNMLGPQTASDTSTKDGIKLSFAKELKEQGCLGFGGVGPGTVLFWQK